MLQHTATTTMCHPGGGEIVRPQETAVRNAMMLVLYGDYSVVPTTMTNHRQRFNSSWLIILTIPSCCVFEMLTTEIYPVQMLFTATYVYVNNDGHTNWLDQFSY